MAVAASALTTLATVLDELELASDGGAVDARLERYINAASDLIAGYCGRTFQYDAAVVEKVAPKGGVRIILERTPVVSITSITDDGTAIDSSEYEVENAAAGFVFRDVGWPSSAALLPGLSYPEVPGTEERTLTVTYAGGYVTPSQVAGELTRTLPHDLEDACVLLVTTRYLARGADMRLRQRAYENATFTFGDTPVPPEVQGTLDRYARLAHG